MTALTKGLHAKIAECHPKKKGITAPRIATVLIIPAPGQPDGQAFVLIRHTNPVANGFKTVRCRRWIFVCVGKVDGGRAEQ